ncbi:MAG: 30S ribosome-binding factor RbfA [bacterium]|nr:30S ribosome-binding factor RbfA [bacterium]
MFDYKRSDRVGQLIQEEISLILLEETKDPRIQFVSITRVEVSDDLKHAKVFASVLGSAEKKKEVFNGLRSAQGFIQKQLGRKLHLRYTPEIVFKMDDSIERGAHIYELLEEIKNEDKLKNEE